MPIHYSNAHTLQQCPYITAMPIHYSNVHTLQQCPYITAMPIHYSNAHTLQQCPYITAMPIHYSNVHTLQQCPYITAMSIHYSNAHTLQQCPYITAMPIHHMCVCPHSTRCTDNMPTKIGSMCMWTGLQYQHTRKEQCHDTVKTRLQTNTCLSNWVVQSPMQVVN